MGCTAFRQCPRGDHAAQFHCRPYCNGKDTVTSSSGTRPQTVSRAGHDRNAEGMIPGIPRWDVQQRLQRRPKRGRLQPVQLQKRTFNTQLRAFRMLFVLTGSAMNWECRQLGVLDDVESPLNGALRRSATQRLRPFTDHLQSTATGQKRTFWTRADCAKYASRYP